MIQTQVNRVRVYHESFVDEKRSVLLPDRVPTLAQIAEQFLSGNPIDQSLHRNIDYNEIERNPFLAKGFDLADLPEIRKQIEDGYKSVNEFVEKMKQKEVSYGASNQLAGPNDVPPEKVE